MRAKLQLQQGEHDDLEGNDEDEDEDEDEEAAGWGAKKRAYYDADEVRVTMLSDASLMSLHAPKPLCSWVKQPVCAIFITRLEMLCCPCLPSTMDSMTALSGMCLSDASPS